MELLGRYEGMTHNVSILVFRPFLFASYSVGSIFRVSAATVDDGQAVILGGV